MQLGTKLTSTPFITADTCISISVLQWLLSAETSHPTSSPPHRLTRFFTTLHAALKNPSRAVFQFYPTSDDQVQLITSIAQKAGFGGGVVVDYPNSKKARKVFLCLFVGGGGGGQQQQQVPKGLEGDEDAEARATFEKRRERLRAREKAGKRKNIKDRDWILKKKEVRACCPAATSIQTLSSVRSTCSSTASGGRKVSPTTQNIPGANGRPCSSFASLCLHVLSTLCCAPC